MKKYLFLCNGGAKRSPTFASVARDIISEKGLDITVLARSSGLIRKYKDTVGEHLDVNDYIVVMDRKDKELIESLGISESKIYCVDVADDYERDDPVLREIAREKLEKLL